ncbi:MAG: hypothetical protein HY815_26035 [Candidatus Riflebacteria bacterium]|nr:hypothetical protein [Candidatus Riflebacteria bacterium]
MSHRKRLLSVVLILSFGYVLYGTFLRAFTLNSREQDLSVIFNTIAAVGKFNVVVDPKVRQKMSVTLDRVDPLQALYIVAKLNGLQVKKLAEVKGKDTYAIAPQDVIERGFEQGFTRAKRLRYAKAEDVAQIVSKGLGKEVNIGVEKDPRTNSLVLRGTEEVLNKVEDLIKELDLPVPQVMIDAKVVTVQTTFTRNLGFLWNFGVGKAADGIVTDKTAGSGSIYAITEYQRTRNNSSFYDSPTNARGSNIFSFGDFYRSNFFLNSAFAALETSGITRTLSSPRLLAINGAQAQLRIGDKIVFSGGPSQPPEERDTGTVMDITPRINKDNFITMDINVEQSTARFDRGDFPTITRTNAKTTVQVKDGEEVLVGGLVQENSSPNKIIVPFLVEIPLIKHFFQKKNNQNTSLELVILLTPRVVKQNVAQDTGEISPPPISLGIGGSKGEAPHVGLPEPGGPPSPGGAGPIVVPSARGSPAGPGGDLSDINDIFDGPKPRGPDTAPSAGPAASAPNGAPMPPIPPPRGGLDIPELGL